MYSSHSYPYTLNQSAHQPPVRHTPMPMPTLPQVNSAPTLSYPHPHQVQSPPRLTYPHPLHPTAATTTSNSPAPMQYPGGGASAGAIRGPGGVGSRPPPEFPLLEHLSVDELQRLLGSDDKLNDIADDGNQAKQRQVDKEMAMAENRSLADFNLSRETRLREGRLQLARLHEEAKSSREVYDVDRRKFDALNENYSLDAAKVMLETAATKTEEESEEIAEEFLSGNIPISDFVEQFIRRRMLAHIRRIKSDKMQELIKSGPSSSAAAAAHPQYHQPHADIPMSTPFGYHQAPSHAPAAAPTPVRPAPSVPARTGGSVPPYQPGYPSHAPGAHQAPAAVPAGGSSWSPFPGAVRLPSLPAYPR